MKFLGLMLAMKVQKDMPSCRQRRRHMYSKYNPWTPHLKHTEQNKQFTPLLNLYKMDSG